MGSFGRTVLGVIVAGLFCGCPNPPDNPPRTYGSFPLIIGMEYALPGLASGLIDVGLPGVKPLPESFSWGEMQPTENAAIDFRFLDRMVGEAQSAGYTTLVLGLRSENPWASVDPSQGLHAGTDPTPKPEHRAAFQAWVRAIVERYDGDGIQDMPDLVRPIGYYEIGVEFSSYEPEPVEDYLVMLDLAYAAAHEAFTDVIVMHVAFLTSTVFTNHPTPEQYEETFAAAHPRIFNHGLAEMRAVLDRPDLFDAVNVHALADPYEIEDIAAWLRFEMTQRGYTRPIVISDTAPAPLIAWGPATVCDRAEDQMGVILPPATEADRCRIAEMFQAVLDGDAGALAWLHGFVAADMVKRVVVAAEQDIALINTAYMEDLVLLTWPIAQAGAGTGAWAGMAETQVNVFTNARTVTGLRPIFYALQQLAGHFEHYEQVERSATENPNVRLYRVSDMQARRPTFYIAWHAPPGLTLADDAMPELAISLVAEGAQATVEALIVEEGRTTPITTTLPFEDGALALLLTRTPIFVFIE
ncbi:MAG: hypothetical protein HYV26_20575 [Candidatus Hydrogenedentes bacterium]|nr:hypothetical protein [Candidatus Hydrogenedentota bacterium]